MPIEHVFSMYFGRLVCNDMYMHEGLHNLFGRRLEHLCCDEKTNVCLDSNVLNFEFCFNHEIVGLVCGELP